MKIFDTPFFRGMASIGEGMATIMSFGQNVRIPKPMSDEEAAEADRKAIQSDWDAVMCDWNKVYKRVHKRPLDKR